MTQRIYNLKRDQPDARDHIKTFSVEHLEAAAAVTSLDLSAVCKMPPAYDQGQLGSCTANSVCGQFWFDLLNGDYDKQSNDLSFSPSRLYLYYKERQIDGDIPDDAGSSLRTGIKALNTYGVCSESLWSYDDGPTKFKQAPPATCDQSAKYHKAVSYKKLPQTLSALKACLLQKLPFVFGFTVYPSFENIGADGVMSMPTADDIKQGDLGGHAVLCIGFDDAKQLFKVRNSWGPSWGLEGNFLMPYAYMLDTELSNDMWSVSVIDSEKVPVNTGGTTVTTDVHDPNVHVINVPKHK